MPDEVEPSFETAVGQLEEIVEALERGAPELTAALDKYEAGVRLLNRCYGLLERAERSVALLTGVDEQGEPISTPFDATATLAREVQRPAGECGSADEPTAGAARKPGRVRRTKPATTPEDDPLDPPF
jgi:exodeoxyribonuclease VII small subunit